MAANNNNNKDNHNCNNNNDNNRYIMVAAASPSTSTTNFDHKNLTKLNQSLEKKIGKNELKPEDIEQIFVENI